MTRYKGESYGPYIYDDDDKEKGWVNNRNMSSDKYQLLINKNDNTREENVKEESPFRSPLSKRFDLIWMN